MIKATLLLGMALLALPLVAARAAEPTSCGLEEVPAGQQMMCVPRITYNEDGEIVSASQGVAR